MTQGLAHLAEDLEVPGSSPTQDYNFSIMLTLPVTKSTGK